MAVKRTTFQEKCDIMLSIFRQKRDFFNAKEIEKLSIKKGVLQQAVKDVLQSLIDDNFVTQEKLGISNYYWSFVNDEGQDAVDMKEKLLKEQKKLIADIEALRKNITSESKGREPSDERTALINEYNSNNEQMQKIEIELKAFAECDPRVFLKRKEEIKSTKEEINKATEDIFVIRDYICNKFGMDRKDFNANFGISDEMDVID